MKYTKDLARLLADELGLPYSRVKNEVLPTTLRAILTLARKDDGLTLTGFGTFRRWDRPSRTGRNPKTGAPVPVPPTSTLMFRPSKKLLKRRPDSGSRTTP